MTWGVGSKRFNARIMPDMLGAKIGTKRVPVRAPDTLTISKCTVFRCDMDARTGEPVTRFTGSSRFEHASKHP